MSINVSTSVTRIARKLFYRCDKYCYDIILSLSFILLFLVNGPNNIILFLSRTNVLTVRL